MRFSNFLPVAALLLLGSVQVHADAGATSEKTTQHYLDEAKVHLRAGRADQALSAYDAAIAKDEGNYNTYFGRATVHLTMGKHHNAMRDFSKVLELRPDHAQALFQRGKLHVRDGDWDAATADLKAFSEMHPDDGSAIQLATDVVEIKRALGTLPSLLSSKTHEEALQILNRAITLAPNNLELRLSRAQLYLDIGDREMAIGDLSRASRMSSNTKTFLKLASVYMALGEPENALTHIKECLRMDPEQKECKREFRALKKLDKAIKAVEASLEKAKFREVISKLTGEDGLIGEVDKIGAPALQKKVYAFACKAYGQTKKHKDVMMWCNKVLELDEQNAEALYFRGEAKIDAEDYDGALRDLQKAHDLNGSDQRIVEAFHRAQKLQKRASQKDYYKILGVSKTATTRDIKKAYKKLLLQWHPDKYKGDLSKDEVEKKMSDINAAYEVLSNDDLRQRFDNGEDPLQPEGGQQYGGNPFGGGHPFFGNGFPGGFPGGGFPGGGFPGGGGQFHFKFGG